MQRSRGRAVVATVALAGALAVVTSCSGTTTTETSSSSTATTTTTSVGRAGADTEGTAVGGTTPSTTGRTSTTVVRDDGSTTTSTTRATSSTTAARPSTTGPVAPEDAAFCAEVTTAQDELGKLDPTTDPEGALAGYKKALSKLADLAPASIRPDVLIVQAAIAGAKTWAELEAAGTPEVRAASERIDTWTSAHCGTTLGGA